MGTTCSSGCSACSKSKTRPEIKIDEQLLSTEPDDTEYSVSSTVDYNPNLRVINNWCKAVESNNEYLCKSLLASNPLLELQNSLVNRETGERAIHIATRNRNTSLIELLGYYEAEFNILSRQSRESPLHIAASMNDTTLIQLLLYFGADPDIPNRLGQIAKDLCRENLENEFLHDTIISLRMMNYPPTWEGRKNDWYLSYKRDEIKLRGDLVLTSFGAVIGCEVDEIGMCCQRLDLIKKSQIWEKVSKNKEYTIKQADINKILVILTAAALQIKKRIKKPDGQQILKLNSFVKRKMPWKDGKKILTQQDFNRNMHKWLYEIHEDPEWRTAA